MPTRVTLATGRGGFTLLDLTARGQDGAFPDAHAGAVNGLAPIVNGIDLNNAYSLNTNAFITLGLLPPDAPTVVAVVTDDIHSAQVSDAEVDLVEAYCSGKTTTPNTLQTVRYRIRRKDSLNGTISLPSADITFAQTIAITLPGAKIVFPAQPAGRQGDYWIVERTTDNGQVFYPVNLGVDANGTPATETYFFDWSILRARVQLVTENRLFEHKRLVGILNDASDTTPTPHLSAQTLDERQAVAPACPLAAIGANRLILGGGIEIQGEATLTNGSADIVATLPLFFGLMAADSLAGNLWRCILLEDTSGALYHINTVTDSTHATLDKVFAGSGATGTLKLFTKRNRWIYSELNQIEYFGEATFLGPANTEFMGDEDGLTAIKYLGTSLGLNRFLFAKADRLFVLSYSLSPSFQDGGRLTELVTRRGALSSRCVLVVDGIAYGLDYRGPWALAPGGEPQDIGAALANDFKNFQLNFAAPDAFWIQLEPDTRKLLFWVPEAARVDAQNQAVGAADSATKAYIYDLNTRRFIGSFRSATSRPGGCTLKDTTGRLRAASWTSTSSSLASSRLLAHNTARCDGPIPAENDQSFPISSIVTAGGLDTFNLGGHFAATHAVLGASIGFQYGNLAFGLAPVQDNDAGDISLVSGAFSTAPIVTQKLIVSAIAWKIWTPRFDCAIPARKKTFTTLWARVRNKGSYSPLKFFVQIYLNGRAAETVPVADNLAYNEDEIFVDANNPSIGVTARDPSADSMNLRIPLNGCRAVDIQFLFFGCDADVPIEFMQPFELLYQLDGAENPTR